jgi:hypothetical protein
MPLVFDLKQTALHFLAAVFLLLFFSLHGPGANHGKSHLFDDQRQQIYDKKPVLKDISLSYFLRRQNRRAGA